jgi:hypothetical protein
MAHSYPTAVAVILPTRAAAPGRKQHSEPEALIFFLPKVGHGPETALRHRAAIYYRAREIRTTEFMKRANTGI